MAETIDIRWAKIVIAGTQQNVTMQSMQNELVGEQLKMVNVQLQWWLKRFMVLTACLVSMFALLVGSVYPK